MKKTVLVLCLLVALCGCSSGSNSTIENKQQQEESAEESKSDLITEEELKSYISKIEISDENWKDIFSADIDFHEEVNNFGEIEIDIDKVEAKFNVKPEYYADMSQIGLELHDNVYGNDLVWENLSEDVLLDVFYSQDSWKYYLVAGAENYHDEGIIYFVYEGSGFYTYDTYPFNMDNFTCVKAGGYVYKVEIPSELIQGEEFKYVDYINAYGNACICPIDTFEDIEIFMS